MTWAAAWAASFATPAPAAVVAVLNPILRVLLRTPLGRLIRPFALVEFTGRQSGKRYRVPVGWHVADDAPIVLTPAPWRSNFHDGSRADVYHRGRRRPMIGTLEADPAAVADTLRRLLASGTSPRTIGLTIPTGHTITAADVTAVRRAVVRFQPSVAPVRVGGPRVDAARGSPRLPNDVWIGSRSGA